MANVIEEAKSGRASCRTCKKAIAKGRSKPGGLPHADKAPTGRARCMQCGEAIAKDSLRVAVEREIETGAMVAQGAGYLHPACAGTYTDAKGGDRAALVEGLRANSRLTDADLAAVVEAVETSPAPSLVPPA